MMTDDEQELVAFGMSDMSGMSDVSGMPGKLGKRISKQKAKYRVGDTVYFVMGNSAFDSIVVGYVDYDEPTKQVYYRTAPDASLFYLQKFLFKSRAAAAKAQVAYWRKVYAREKNSGTTL